MSLGGIVAARSLRRMTFAASKDISIGALISASLNSVVAQSPSAPESMSMAIMADASQTTRRVTADRHP